MKMLFCWCNSQSDYSFMTQTRRTYQNPLKCERSNSWRIHITILNDSSITFIHSFAIDVKVLLRWDINRGFPTQSNTMWQHFIIMKNYLTWLIGFIINWKWNSFCFSMRREGEKKSIKTCIVKLLEWRK